MEEIASGEASRGGLTATLAGYQSHVKLIKRKKRPHPALVAVNKEMFKYMEKGDREVVTREFKHNQPPKQ